MVKSGAAASACVGLVSVWGRKEGKWIGPLLLARCQGSRGRYSCFKFCPSSMMLWGSPLRIPSSWARGSSLFISPCPLLTLPAAILTGYAARLSPTWTVKANPVHGAWAQPHGEAHWRGRNPYIGAMIRPARGKWVIAPFQVGEDPSALLDGWLIFSQTWRLHRGVQARRHVKAGGSSKGAWNFLLREGA